MDTQNLEPNLHKTLKELIDQQSLISGVLSQPKTKQAALTKMTVRPLLIQNKRLYQLSEYTQNKVQHHNVSPSECLARLCKAMTHDFKQAHIFSTEADFHILTGHKENISILKKKPSKFLTLTPHNRKKAYLLEEGDPVPFLVDLGIMHPSGKIIDKKRDKFIQINRFLELADEAISQLKQRSLWHIIDFGCGKAYLTFALFHFLTMHKKLNVHMIGLDLKEDVIQFCQALADRLGYTNLTFKIGNIADHQSASPIDMVISLHACDTATDAALAKAVKWHSEAILCVPCCQHELLSQVKNEVLTPLLKHGILKERFSALATDAARGQLLEIHGYHTQILEFIDFEHTAKNLMIRAIKKNRPFSNEALIKKYREFTENLHIRPSLETLLSLEK